MTGSSSEGTAALSVASSPATSSRLAELADAAAVAGIPANLLRSPRHLEVLIPARNEAQRLPRTLMRTVEYLEAQPYSSSVVVVDNDSVDQTVDLASQVRSDRVLVNVIGCAQRGKGAAVRRGILTSRARFLGYMDADLATPIETLDFVLPLLEADCQAVVGSRRVGGAVYAERQPAHRVVSSMIFRTVASRVAPGFADTQCGFKFFAGDLARAAARRLRIDGFAFDVELLRAVTEMGVAVKEIPVVWSDRKGSTLRVLDGARAVADVLHLARRRAA
jgi:dolichyl-phosphate beta-glucosyltransferase